MKNFTLDEWIEWQCKLHSTNMDFNLSRIKEVAARLNIGKTKSKVFTIAGTNGKGSTVAILESILIESGYSVGSYTSPHLLEFNERIKINKIPASTKEICNAFEIIEESRKDITLTYFEFSTLAAFIIFSQKKLDILILEVGLGGRLDAVNIIDSDVSVITNIGLDHTSILGSNMEKIALEKSGVMRKYKPTIVGYSGVHDSIIKYSNEVDATLSIFNKHFSGKIYNGKKWIFENIDGVRIECDYPGIRGDIQINNAATAIQAIHSCDGIELNKKYLQDGLKKSEILGRFQILNTVPETILDIAHNEQSISLLINNINKYYPKKKFHAVFSVLKDKNIDEMLNLLKGIFKSWHIAESDNDRALKVTELNEKKFFLTERASSYDSIVLAYEGALNVSNTEEDVIIVFGSSYTVAPILNKKYKK
ncbi:bifunctional folylpolyglutamate synthase/dihydrofolate synthase [Gammaproteobacteria bacterium]|nr:bifunctional folylpolyglutamate synthase/dihydrofolate synthase [Gammaproteobacteria bacterium]